MNANRKIYFNEYSEGTQSNFADMKDFKTFGKICVDTYNHSLQGQTVEQGNEVIRNKMKAVMGLGENPTDLQIKRALKKTSVREAIFEIIEETLDRTLVTGWGNDPFFKKYVDFKTNVLGQTNSFYIKNDCVITVSKTAGGHHNLERQRLGAGTTRTIKVGSYGAKVYMEMSRFIQGVEDWTELIDSIAAAFTLKINTMIHDAVMSAADALPVPTKWKLTCKPAATNKVQLKKLINDVKMATGSNVVLMGTDSALSQLTGFADVAWASDEAKSEVFRSGRIGSFEGVTLIEIPQAFSPTLVDDDVNAYLEDDSKILVMPANIDKFVKFYYEGADEIVEHSEIADNGDDTKDYEFKSTFGIETMTNVRFGLYTISA